MPTTMAYSVTFCECVCVCVFVQMCKVFGQLVPLEQDSFNTAGDVAINTSVASFADTQTNTRARVLSDL